MNRHSREHKLATVALAGYKHETTNDGGSRDWEVPTRRHDPCAFSSHNPLGALPTHKRHHDRANTQQLLLRWATLWVRRDLASASHLPGNWLLVQAAARPTALSTSLIRTVTLHASLASVLPPPQPLIGVAATSS